MIYEFALFCALGVGLWIGLDVLGGARRSVEFLALGASLALWAGGELVIHFVGEGSEVLCSAGAFSTRVPAFCRSSGCGSRRGRPTPAGFDIGRGR
jgi:hypothetical protein